MLLINNWILMMEDDEEEDDEDVLEIKAEILTLISDSYHKLNDKNMIL